MPFNPKSLENLMPAQKGDIRNPFGKTGISVKKILKKWFESEGEMDNPITEKTEKMSYLEAIILPQILKAKKGDLDALKVLLDRYEGRPKQGLDITERKYDDLENMSERELRDKGIEVLARLRKRLDSGNSTTSED